MTAARSAGILLYRRVQASGLEVWLVHMGGPFWSRKDSGAWSIPKGEHDETEDALEVARREFEEENGVAAPDLDYELLGEFRQPSGKVVTVFVAEFDGDLEWVASNTFAIEWPPRSGRVQDFPEVDRAEWSASDLARDRLVKGQIPLIDALERRPR